MTPAMVLLPLIGDDGELAFITRRLGEVTVVAGSGGRRVALDFDRDELVSWLREVADALAPSTGSGVAGDLAGEFGDGATQVADGAGQVGGRSEDTVGAASDVTASPSAATTSGCAVQIHHYGVPNLTTREIARRVHAAARLSV